MNYCRTWVPQSTENAVYLDGPRRSSHLINPETIDWYRPELSSSPRSDRSTRIDGARLNLQPCFRIESHHIRWLASSILMLLLSGVRITATYNEKVLELHRNASNSLYHWSIFDTTDSVFTHSEVYNSVHAWLYHHMAEVHFVWPALMPKPSRTIITLPSHT